MVDKSVSLITISEENKLVLHNSVLENLFQNIDCPFAILTVINDSENFDPVFLDLVLCYLANNGKHGWINKSFLYRWNSDPYQEITSGIKVWSRPLQMFENHGKYLDVILMENYISGNVSEDIMQKLMAFSINISSNIIYNTDKCLIRYSFRSLEESLKYTKYTEENKNSFMFLLRECNGNNHRYGAEGRRHCDTNILYDQEYNKIDIKLKKHFWRIRFFDLPASKRPLRPLTPLLKIGPSNHPNTDLTTCFKRLINKYFKWDQISVTNLNAFECLQKIKIFINSFESNREAEQSYKAIKGEAQKMSKPTRVILNNTWRNNSPENHDGIQMYSDKSQVFKITSNSKPPTRPNSQRLHRKTTKNKSFFNSLTSRQTKNINESFINMGSEINHLESYIDQSTKQYVYKFQRYLNRNNFLNCSYFNSIHNYLFKDELRKFHDIWKSSFSNKRDEQLLVKNLDAKYEQIQSCQHVFIQFWNYINQEFKRSIYFELNGIQNLCDEWRNRLIQVMNPELEGSFNESILSVFDDTSSYFFNLNNDIIAKETIIAENNILILREMYVKKLTEKIMNNSFDRRALLDRYHNALTNVCIESLNAGLVFKVNVLEKYSEFNLRTMLGKTFETIYKVEDDQIYNDKIIQESLAIYNQKMKMNLDTSYPNAIPPQKLINSHHLIKNEIISIANSKGLTNDGNILLGNQIETYLKHYIEDNDKRVKIIEPILAIDFGTCFVRYGYITNGRTEISNAIPNCVAFSGKEILIGEDAEKFAQIQPENVIIHSKLFLGGPDFDFVKSELYSFEICKNEENFIEFLVNFNGRKTAFRCEEIISLVLIKIRRDVELSIGTQVTDCVITVPNSFNVAQREGLKSAAAIAGLNVKTLINDITAATIGYQMKPEGLQNEIIIAHSGSNNFNIALMRLNFQSNQDLQIVNLYNSYALNCTGIAINNVLMRSGSKFKSENYRLRKDCEKSKLKLGDENTRPLEPIDRQYIKKYFDIVDRNFRNFMEVVDRDRKVRPIILIGGSFKFKNLFRFYFQIKKKNSRIHYGDDDLIIRGATLYAHSLWKNKPQNKRNIEIIERLNSTISTNRILLKKRKNFFNIFKSNDSDSKNTIPLNASLPLQIEIQKELKRESKVFQLYQGENIYPNPYSNQFIGSFALDIHSKAQKVKVNINMNCECIISLDGYQFNKYKLSDEMIKSCFERLRKIYQIEELDDSNEHSYYSTVEITEESNNLQSDESDDHKEFLKFLAEFERDFMNVKSMGEMSKGTIRNTLKKARAFAEDSENFNKEGIKLHIKILESTRNRFLNK